MPKWTEAEIEAQRLANIRHEMVQEHGEIEDLVAALADAHRLLNEVRMWMLERSWTVMPEAKDIYERIMRHLTQHGGGDD